MSILGWNLKRKAAGLFVLACAVIAGAVFTSTTASAADPCVGTCSAPAGAGSDNLEDAVPNVNVINQYLGQTQGGLIQPSDDPTTVQHIIIWAAEETGNRLGSVLDPTGGGEVGLELDNAVRDEDNQSPSEAMGDQFRDTVEEAIDPPVDVPDGLPDGNSDTTGENCFGGRTVYGPVSGCVGG